MVRSSGAEPSITVVLLLGALGAGILLLLVRRRLSHAGAWRLIAVLAALVTPLIIVLVAAIVEDGNLNSMRSFFIALTEGELFVLLPALPFLRRQSRLALLTPEMPNIFKFVMRRGNR